MKISILIPSLWNRSEQKTQLVYGLISQLGEICYHYDEVQENYTREIYTNGVCEVIIDIDNKQVTTGEKRNRLVNAAKGEYIIFIDDDDEVPGYYVCSLLDACESNADCFAINGKMTTDGAKEIKWRLSKDYENVTIKENGVDVYLRKTNHITGVKREIALKCPFPNKSNAEDKSYSDAINKFLKSEFVISLPMYHYKFSTKNKEY